MRMNRIMKIGFLLILTLVIITPYNTFAESDTITLIGVNNDYPFFFYDVNGRPSGYALDFISKFAEEEGKELIVELYDSQTALEAFEDHGDFFYDGSYFRSIRGDKSLPLFVQEYYLYAPKDTVKTISPDDLHSFYEATTKFSGHNIGIRKGQTIDDYIASLAPEDHIMEYETIYDVFMALQRKEIDIALLPFHQSNSVLDHFGIDDIEFVDQKLYFKNTGYWSKDDKLLHKLDSFVLTNKKSGYITKLNNTWLADYELGNREELYLTLFNVVLGISIALILFLIYRGNTLQIKVNSRTRQLREKLDENRQLYDEIIRHEKFKNDYFINLSHELRTPLNVILGAIQLNELYLTKKSYDKLLENADSFTSIIKGNSYRLLRVVNNLIDITKMDADKYTLNIDLVDIVYLAEELTMAIQPYADKKRIKISIEADVDEIVIECDPFEIERVFMNLLSNAIKFTGIDGEINVHIYFDPSNTYANVAIKDNGIGISPDNQSKIFDRFAQVDTTLNRNHEGHGIGLSLVKNIVDLHGGIMEVDSELNKGSTFTFRLPVKTNYIGFDSSGFPLGQRQHDRQHALSLEFSELQQEFNGSNHSD